MNNVVVQKKKKKKRKKKTCHTVASEGCMFFLKLKIRGNQKKKKNCGVSMN